jgi:hypothetical protein
VSKKLIYINSETAYKNNHVCFWSDLNEKIIRIEPSGRYADLTFDEVRDLHAILGNLLAMIFLNTELKE